PTLPEPVRTRVVALVAGALTQLPAAELPVQLRRVANFAPNRRARLGAGAIAAQLVGDPLFRQRIATKILADAGELGTAVEAGATPAPADPIEVAALASLARPEGWLELIEEAAHAVRADVDSAMAEARFREVEARAVRAEHERAVARVEADKLRDEAARLRDEVAALRDEVRALGRELRETQGKERRASEPLALPRGP